MLYISGNLNIIIKKRLKNSVVENAADIQTEFYTFNVEEKLIT